MSENALAVIQDGTRLPATVREYRGDYQISLYNDQTFTLKRGVDFGKPTEKLKQPVLFKAGAEKIRYEYGVFDRYTLMDKIEDLANGFFMYCFRCELVRYEGGEPFVVAEGYGSANTREANVGSASGFDVANTKLKIAEKRAMMDAVIKLARLSSIFTQDMENDTFMEGADAITKAKPTDEITSKQRKRIFALAAVAGMTQEQTRTWLTAQGFASTKDIKQSDYDALCEKLIQEGEGHASEAQ